MVLPPKNPYLNVPRIMNLLDQDQRMVVTRSPLGSGVSFSAEWSLGRKAPSEALAKPPPPPNPRKRSIVSLLADARKVYSVTWSGRPPIIAETRVC